ncbi:hypothetical protein [Algihabitans sp.]|uniref:hypothetical protein n=1 Tax=Algihabitans sp. TaxID=2821514 RepID=UPI003BA9FE37
MTDAPEVGGRLARKERGPKRQPETREERLAEALRANLRRRKAQARGRRDQPADTDPGGAPDQDGFDQQDATFKTEDS